MQTYPDLHALEYAIAHAEATGNAAKVSELRARQKRSKAHGDGYGTHIPVLASVVSLAYGGPILELGAGHFSTPLLNALGRAQGRKVVTLDADLEWLNQFADLDLGSEDHLFIHVTDMWKGWRAEMEALWAEMDNNKWAVALVDQTPPQTRVEAIEYLRDKAEFIVVHDSCNSFFAGVDEALATFKHRAVYSLMTPPTTVVSNSTAIPKF